MTDQLASWEFHKGNVPAVAAAIHNGHKIREDLMALLAISEEDRSREEDPFTGQWTTITDTRIVVNTSRFEIDLNRPREKAIYLEPEDAWGLTIWKTKPPPEVIRESLKRYDAFYAEAKELFMHLEKRFGSFMVFDLHSYNHRRESPDDHPAGSAENPEVNIGTGTMDRERWAPIVDQFIKDLRSFNFLGRHLDVRENIKFRGGYFSRWIHQTFPHSGCALAIEFKKFFMDEWTGTLNLGQHAAIHNALKSTVPSVQDILRSLSKEK